VKVAVTGASGLLRPALVQGLLVHGHTVHVLVRNVEQSLARLPAGVMGAPLQAEAPLPPGRRKQRIRNSRTQGTRRLDNTEPITNAKSGHTLAQGLGRPSVMSVLAFVLKAALGEGAMRLPHGQRVLPQRRSAAGVSFQPPAWRGP
jgi:NAD dependent epimerase/dehydratase family enzyme